MAEQYARSDGSSHHDSARRPGCNREESVKVLCSAVDARGGCMATDQVVVIPSASRASNAMPGSMSSVGIEENPKRKQFI